MIVEYSDNKTDIVLTLKETEFNEIIHGLRHALDSGALMEYPNLLSLYESLVDGVMDTANKLLDRAERQIEGDTE